MAYAKVQELAHGWWAHRLRITEPGRLAEELQDRLRENYRLTGMQDGWEAPTGRDARTVDG